MKKYLIAIASLFAVAIAAQFALAAAYPPALGGLGTTQVPASGTIPIGTGAGTYTPALLTGGSNIVITNASGSVTISVNGSSFLSSSTVYVATVNGQSGAVTITSSTLGVATNTISLFNGNGFATTTIQSVLNALSATGLLTYNSSTGAFGFTSSTLNLGTAAGHPATDFLASSTIYVSTSTGNWAGTWQGVNSTTFYLSSNPNGYVTVSGFLNAATSTQANTFTVSTTTTKITITIPPAHDQYFAPSTTIPTNNNQLANGFGFITGAPATATINGTNGNTFTFTASSTGSALSITTSTNGFVNFLLQLSQFLSAALTSLNGATSSQQSFVGTGGVSVSTVASSPNSTTTISFSSSSLNLGTAAFRPLTDFLASSTNLAPSTTIPTAFVSSFNGATSSQQSLAGGTGILVSTGAASPNSTTTISFATTSVSQFTNDAGYVTSSLFNATGTASNFPFWNNTGNGLAQTSTLTYVAGGTGVTVTDNATNTQGFSVSRNVANAGNSTALMAINDHNANTGANPTILVQDSNTTNQWATLSMTGVRTGRVFDLTENGNGVGERISQNGNGTALLINQSSTASALVINDVGTSSANLLEELEQNGSDVFTVASSGSIYASGTLLITNTSTFLGAISSTFQNAFAWWGATGLLGTTSTPATGGLSSYNVFSINPFISVSTTTTSAALTYSSSSLNLGTAANHPASDFLASSTTFVVSVNGLSGVLTITSSSLGVLPPIPTSTLNGQYLQIGNNFSDLNNTSTARTTLGFNATSSLVLSATTGIQSSYIGSNCAGGQAANGLSATGTVIGCFTPSGGSGFTAANASSGIAVTTSTSLISIQNIGVTSLFNATGSLLFATSGPLLSNIQQNGTTITFTSVPTSTILAGYATSTNITGGSCTNCNITFNSSGQSTVFSNGAGGGGSSTVQLPTIIVSSQAGANFGNTQLTQAVKAADNTVNYPNGALIWLPDANYTVTSTGSGAANAALKLASNVILKGNGRLTKINWAAPTKTSVLIAASGTVPVNIGVNNLYLNQTSSSDAGVALDFSNWGQSTVSQMESAAFTYTMQANDTSDNTFYDHFEDWQAYDDNGINMSSTNSINDNYFTGIYLALNQVGGTGPYTGLYLNNGQTNTFVNLNCEPFTLAHTTCIDVESVNAEDNQFIDSYIENTATGTVIHNAERTTFENANWNGNTTNLSRVGDTNTTIIGLDNNFGVPINILSAPLGFQGGSAVTLSSCGTGSPTVNGTDNAGTITTGSGSTSACTLNFVDHWSATPTCTATTDTTSSQAAISSVSTSALTINLSTALTAHKLYYTCFGNNND